MPDWRNPAAKIIATRSGSWPSHPPHTINAFFSAVINPVSLLLIRHAR